VQFDTENKDKDKSKDNKERIKLGSTKKLKSFVNRNIIKKKDDGTSSNRQSNEVISKYVL